MSRRAHRAIYTTVPARASHTGFRIQSKYEPVPVEKSRNDFDDLGRSGMCTIRKVSQDTDEISVRRNGYISNREFRCRLSSRVKGPGDNIGEGKTVIGRKVSVLGLVVLMVVVALGIVSQPAQASHSLAPNGPWLDRIVWTVNSDPSQALTDIIEGRSDVWDFNLPSATDRARARASFSVTPIETYGSVRVLEINPMVQQSQFSMNPFSIQKVREAMQYLVDRDLIIREIEGGAAIPHVVPFLTKSADYGRFIETAVQLEDKYRPNPALAKTMITEGMQAAGATLDANGKWHDSQGRLVEVVVWSRVEDSRLLIGRYVSNLLDGMGFTAKFTPVDRTFINKVYGGPADLGLWNIYTGGFSFTSVPFLDDAQMYAFHGCVDEPWCNPTAPGGPPNPGGYVPPKELYDGALKVYEGNYSSLDERQAIVEKILPIAVSENREMWLLDQAALFPTNARMSVGYDLFGGTNNIVAKRALKIIGGRCAYEGGSLCVGRYVNFLPGQAAWNPWLAGTNTLYDGVVQDGFVDQGVVLHPHKADYVGWRTPFEVTTTGPSGTPLSVPSTALKYDVTTNTWVAVGSSVTATSKVVFTPAFGKWHTGQAINVEDIKAEISFGYRRAVGDVSLVLPNAASTGLKTFLPKYKGYEFTGTTYTVYIDFFNFDTTQVAANANWWPQVPWEVELTAAKTLLDLQLANNERDSTVTGRPRLDLTKGVSLGFLTSAMNTLATANAVPPGSSVSAPEATARWTALRSWVTTYGHFWPSNGPFFLAQTDFGNFQFTLDAFRDGYPLKADFYDQYLVPRIPKITFPAAPSVVFSGTPGVFDFTSTVAGNPYDAITVKWLLKDLGTGQIVSKGTSSKLGAGAYRIELASSLTDQLLFGNFQLLVVVSSADASPPSIAKPTFLILPSVTYFEGLVSATESALRADITKLEGEQTDLRSALTATRASSEGLGTLVTVLTAVALIAVVISVVTLVRVLRKPPTKPMGEMEQAPPRM